MSTASRSAVLSVLLVGAFAAVAAAAEVCPAPGGDAAFVSAHALVPVQGPANAALAAARAAPGARTAFLDASPDGGAPSAALDFGGLGAATVRASPGAYVEFVDPQDEGLYPPAPFTSPVAARAEGLNTDAKVVFDFEGGAVGEVGFVAVVNNPSPVVAPAVDFVATTTSGRAHTGQFRSASLDTDSLAFFSLRLPAGEAFRSLAIVGRNDGAPPPTVVLDGFVVYAGVCGGGDPDADSADPDSGSGEGFFRCPGTEAYVPRAQVHDGYVDCDDGSDETCFLCSDDSACVAKDDLHPEYAQCEDGSDLVELTLSYCEGGKDSCTGAVCSSPSTRAAIYHSPAGECGP